MSLKIGTLISQQSHRRSGLVLLWEDLVQRRSDGTVLVFDVMNGGRCTDARPVDTTIEEAMRPYLVPFGLGANKAGLLAQYTQHRASMLFSPFTLGPQYLLDLHLMRQADVLLTQSRQICLQSCLTRARKRSPEKTEAELLKHVVRYNMTSGTT